MTFLGQCFVVFCLVFRTWIFGPEIQTTGDRYWRKFRGLCRMEWKSFRMPYWRLFMAWTLPFAFLPLCFAFKTQVNAARCAYVLILMGCYWILELLPIPVTGLLPVIMFPLLGIQSAKDVSSNYFQDSVMLFVGGLLVASAVERTNLHQRIALRVLLLVGSKPQWVMAGFMLTAGALSMFISNSATTAMILPIAIAVNLELNKQKKRAPSGSTATLQTDVTSVDFWAPASKGDSIKDPQASECISMDLRHGAENKTMYDDNLDFKQLPVRQQEVSKALVLSVAYASSIGGFATLTGTLTNVVFVGQFQKIFPSNSVVTYASFTFFAFPTMVICLVFAWACLSVQYIFIPNLRTRSSGKKVEQQDGVKAMLQTRYRQLGSMRFSEASVLVIFVLLVLLWLFRSPGFMDGWSVAFKSGYVTDATPAVLLGFLLFIWPNTNPFRRNSGEVKASPILKWKETCAKFPWDVVLLLGGALALADGVEVSGLTNSLGNVLGTLSFLPPTALVVLLSVIVTCCTEVATNAAIASIFLPIVAKLAVSSGAHPLYYMLAVTLSCSFGFMFPVATPPNAIAFGCGFLKVADMVKAGTVVKVGCVLLMIASLHTFGQWVFDLNQFPSWAANSTVAISATTMFPVSNSSF